MLFEQFNVLFCSIYTDKIRTDHARCPSWAVVLVGVLNHHHRDDGDRGGQLINAFRTV